MRAKMLLKRKKISAYFILLSLLNFIFPQNSAAFLEKEYKIKKYKNYASATELSKMPGLPEIKNRKARRYFYLTVTAYSSSPDECSGDPFITASGEKVKDGTLAYNYLPFGTKVRFPEIFGEKVFTVTDRMASSKGKYIADIWMPSKAEAKKWGAKILKMEIL